MDGRGHRWGRRHALAGLSLGAMLTVVGHGCVLISSADDTQCETDAECTSRGPDFDGTVCSEGVCVSRLDTGCQSNAECTEDLGGPALCNQTSRECVSLLSEDCVRVLGDPTVENTVPIGFLFPAKGDLAFFSDIAAPFLELAIADFNSQGGIPGPQGTRRNLVVVICDEINDINRAATYLVDEIQVPGIVGPGISDLALAIADIAFPKNTFVILPFANSEATEALQDGGLLWHLRTTEDRQARVLTTLFNDTLEERIRAENGLTEDEDLRVAVFHRDDDQGLSMANYVIDYLDFNGESALDQPENYLAKPYDSQCFADATPPEECFADVVTEFVDFAPHVVFGIGQVEMHNAMQFIEEGLDADAPRPYYLYSDGAFGADPLLGIVAERPDLRDRIVGVFDYTDFETDLFRKFALRFEGQFGVPPEFGFESLYDAMMVTGLGVAAASQVPALSGKDIAAGVGKLTGPGPKIALGEPNDITTAYGQLGAGASVDIVGLTGELDFNVLTGSYPRDWVLWCLEENADDPDGPPNFNLSGQYAIWNTSFDTSAAECPFAEEGDESGGIDCGRFDPDSTYSCE